jgi:hypothetical protein
VFFLAVLALLSSLLTVESAGAQTVDVLAVETFVSYRPAVADARVDVEFRYEFENTTTDAAFPGFFETLPDAAMDIDATQGDTNLPKLGGVPEDGFVTWLITFDERLDPGESASVVLRWSLVADQVTTIVEPGAVSLDVYVPGPAHSTWHPAEVVLPASFRPIVPTTSQVDGTDESLVAWSAATSAPYESERFAFLDDAGFTAAAADDLPEGMTVADWSTSGDWSEAVLSRAAAVAGELEDWFGPRDDLFTIRRAFPGDEHPRISTDPTFGFDVVELAGDDADSIDHQLAHVWLTGVPFVDTAFAEGFAHAFAGTREAGEAPSAASIIPDLVDEMSVSGVRAVIDALRDGSISYPGAGAAVQPLPADDRMIIDLMENVGGVDDAAAAFRSFETNSDLLAAYDQRAAARADYLALEFRAGGWSLPPYLREAMAGWEFVSFSDTQAAVSEVLTRRDVLQAWAESLDLEPRLEAQDAFESAVADMSEVNAILDAQEAALAAFDEAERLVNGDRGLLARIGAAGSDPDAELAALRAAWAEGDDHLVENHGHELAETVEGAVGRGTIRLLVPALLILALWQGLRLVRRKLVEGRPAAVAAD